MLAIFDDFDKIGSTLKKLFEDSVVKLDELWITSKPWSSNHHPEDVLNCVVDVTDDENIELWRITHKHGRQLESYHNSSLLTFCIPV
ncbi:hypothetical protein RYX36_020400 [Vicia faba]